MSARNKSQSMITGHIDGHAHLSFIAHMKRADFFNESQALGIGRHILGGYNPPDWQEQLKLRNDYGDVILTAFGLHPWHIINSPATQLVADMNELVRLLPQADFIGETGIDRFQKSSGQKISAQKDQLQIEYFKKHLQLAADHAKPIVLHVVKAHSDALQILDHFKGINGIAHGFAGSPDLARRYHKLGYFISIGPGVLSEKGYRKLKETVRDLPLEYLTLESDSPHSPQDLTPQPRLLLEVAGAVAKLKKVTREKVLQASNENLLALLQ